MIGYWKVLDLYIMLGVQKEWVNLCTEITHLDGTYNICSEKYVLFTLLTQDENLHGLPIAYDMIRNETDHLLDLIYNEFKKIVSVDKIKYFFVDKDLANIKLLRQHFPQFTIYLCSFHVIKYLHGEIAKLPMDTDEKIHLMNIVHSMVYSDNLDDYQKLTNKTKTNKRPKFQTQG